MSDKDTAVATKEELLRARVSDVIAHGPGVAPVIVFQRGRDGSNVWEREREGWNRYVRIKVSADGPVWDYRLTWGEWPVPAGTLPEGDRRGFDSHKAGHVDFIVRVVQSWLMDWDDWRDVPSMRELPIDARE